MQSEIRQQVINWLSKGKENAHRLVELSWKIDDSDETLVLEHEKVPFIIFIQFKEKTTQLLADTGIETATIENKARLAMYRVLLILNKQMDKSKFMLEGTNENIMARIDLDNSTITRKELDEALNILLSSIYMMVEELNLQEQFHERIMERMYMMIDSMEREGKNQEEIITFLTRKTGVKEEEARALLRNVTGQSVMSREEEEMYR